EIEFHHPLLVVPSPVPSSDDLHLIVRHAHTPATVDTESEPEEAPSETEEFEASNPSDTRITSSYSSASSDSIAPLSPDHPLTQTLPTPTPTQVSFHHRTARVYVCVNVDYVGVGTQSIERGRLIGIGVVLDNSFRSLLSDGEIIIEI
ncbi:hypothetical protein Tco_1309298, partial [Tanacetum coccineum]